MEIVTMKHCKVCNKEFEPTSAKQVFCSPACKMKEARAKKKLPVEKTFDGVFKKLAEQNGLVDKTWEKEIEEYCGVAGITPKELIETHKYWSVRMSGVKDAMKQKVTITSSSTDEIKIPDNFATLSRTDKMKFLNKKK